MDNLTINGVSILALVMGLVEFSKSLGVKGRALTVTSVAVGAGLILLNWLATQYGWADLFGQIVFALAFGLAASGLYDLGKRLGGRSA